MENVIQKIKIGKGLDEVYSSNKTKTTNDRQTKPTTATTTKMTAIQGRGAGVAHPPWSNLCPYFKDNHCKIMFLFFDSTL